MSELCSWENISSLLRESLQKRWSLSQTLWLSYLEMQMQSAFKFKNKADLQSVEGRAQGITKML